MLHPSHFFFLVKRVSLLSYTLEHTEMLNIHVFLKPARIGAAQRVCIFPVLPFNKIE